MKIINSSVVLSIFLLAANLACAQIDNPVKWSYGVKKIGSYHAIVYFKADMQRGWHIYSTKQPPGGPLKTSINLEPGNYKLSGTLHEPPPLVKYVDILEMDTFYFEGSVVFSQAIQCYGAHSVVRGKISYMVCNDSKCLSAQEIQYSIPVY